MESKGSESAGRKSLVSLAVLAAALVPLAYALSVGPAAWLFANHYLSE
ncbi:MAG: hypothetical protein L0211_21405 [Planctomycetaceae bacterium]|nr:hypothetical protein [Planctomycetaceae bacterium]